MAGAIYLLVTVVASMTVSTSRLAGSSGALLEVVTLADTTVLLLLAVFIAVNVSALLLRGDRVSHDHFQVPVALPVLGVGSCLLVMTQVEAETWARAGALLGVGLLLWVLQRIGRRQSASGSRSRRRRAGPTSSSGA